MKITLAQRTVLELLDSGPVTDLGLTVYQIRARTLRRLSEAGLVKYRPYGKPPSWAITAEGKKVLRDWV